MIWTVYFELLCAGTSMNDMHPATTSYHYYTLFCHGFYSSLLKEFEENQNLTYFDFSGLFFLTNVYCLTYNQIRQIGYLNW